MLSSLWCNKENLKSFVRLSISLESRRISSLCIRFFVQLAKEQSIVRAHAFIAQYVFKCGPCYHRHIHNIKLKQLTTAGQMCIVLHILEKKNTNQIIVVFILSLRWLVHYVCAFFVLFCNFNWISTFFTVDFFIRLNFSTTND